MASRLPRTEPASPCPRTCDSSSSSPSTASFSPAGKKGGKEKTKGSRLTAAPCRPFYTNARTHTHTHMYICMYACMHACMYVYTYIHPYVLFICIYKCMYVCMHVCMYVCIYVCMYVCIYIHPHIYRLSSSASASYTNTLKPHTLVA
jgi:hypothetical protein